MRFTIKTRSTFEHVYIIEAPNEEDAISIVMNEAVPPDFYQKHLGEKIISIDNINVTPEELRSAGYF